MPLVQTPPKRAVQTRRVFAVAAALLAGFGTVQLAQTTYRMRSANAPTPKTNPYLAPFSNPYPRQQNGLRFVTVLPAVPHISPARPTASQFWQQVSAAFSRTPPDFWEGRGASIPRAVIELPPGSGGLRLSSFTASARASTGDTFPLFVSGGFSGSPAPGVGVKDFAEVSLPFPGVPATYQWIDVFLDDHNGHTGTWRVYDLPLLKHAVLPATPLQQSQTVQNIHLSARAWWDSAALSPINKTVAGSSDTNALPVAAQIKAEVPQSAFSAPTQNLSVEIVSITPEWDDPARTTPFNQGGSGGMGNAYGSRSFGGPNYLVNAAAYSFAASAIAPHPAAQHIARIDANLTQFDTHTETVIFRDVPLEADGNGWRIAQGGAEKTTPSGVRVSLTKPLPEDDTAILTSRDVCFKIAITPETGLLPASPLKKRVGAKTLVRVTGDVPGGAFGTMRWRTHSGDDKSFPNVRLTYAKPVSRPVLAFLAITINQEATMRAVPVSFVVPVTHGKPKERWDDY